MHNKKIILSLLAIIFLIGPFITTTYFIVKKQELKFKFFERLSNEHLQKVEVDVNKIVWENEGREMIIKGHLFDVKTITFDSNKAIITGWFDEDEDEINVSINTSQQQPSKEKITTPFFSYTFCTTIKKFKLERFEIFVTKKYPICNVSPVVVFLSNGTPPPKV